MTISKSQILALLSPLEAALYKHFSGRLEGKRIGVWGVSDEQGEIDLAVCLTINWLIEQGAIVRVHDEYVVDQLREYLNPSVEYPEKHWDAVRQADAVIVSSRRAIYTAVDAGRLRWLVEEPVVFDDYGTLDSPSLKYGNFTHYKLRRDEVPDVRRVSDRQLAHAE